MSIQNNDDASLKVCHDVGILGFFTGIIVVVAIYFPFMLFSVFGFLPYSLVVIFSGILKMSLRTMMGLFSVTGFLQVAVIKNMRLIIL